LDESGADPEGALVALLALHDQRPGYAGINRRIARLQVDRLQHTEALRFYERVYRAEPDDVDSLLMIVKLKVRLENDDGALLALDPLMGHERLGGEAAYQMASIHERRGDRERAFRCLTSVLDLPAQVSFRAAAMHGRMLMEDGDLSGAHARFEQARAGKPDLLEALKGLADTSRRLGRHDEAKHWDRVLAILLSLKDDSLIRTPERADKRLGLLSEITDVYPDWYLGFRELANQLVQRGDTVGACHVIESMLVVHGDQIGNQGAEKLRRAYCQEP
jgi:tetratricopeptide (TPR) repeat protein